jgi:signal transduction histidine kinase
MTTTQTPLSTAPAGPLPSQNPPALTRTAATLRAVILGLLIGSFLFTILPDSWLGGPGPNIQRIRVSTSSVFLVALFSFWFHRRQHYSIASTLILLALPICILGTAPLEKWGRPFILLPLVTPVGLAPLIAPPISAMLLGIIVVIVLVLPGWLSADPALAADPSILFTYLGLAFLSMLAGRAVEQKTQELEQANTQLAKKNDQIEGAMDHLVAANQTREALLATLSHDLRSPVATILIYNDMLRDSLRRSLKPEDTRSFEVVQNNGEFLLKLMEDLLNISKVQAGKLVLELEAVNSRAFFAELAVPYVEKAGRKGLELEFDVSHPAPILWADSLRLTQVMNNLISNAIKYTSKGQVRIEVSAASSGQAIIRVSDTGEGISAADLPTIFEPFTQTARTRKREDSTGLGLSIAKHLIEAHGGQVSVESTLGQGTTFTVLWPLAPAEQRPKIAA